MKLRRNPFGSTHSMATAFSRGRGNCDDMDSGLVSPSTSSSDLSSLEEKSPVNG
jgi:hypothetical protein